MREKGFTLVELLGVIMILSIVMMIAIPNIASTLEKSKREQYIVDAKKMISLVDYELRRGEVNKPAEGNIVKITLGYLATSDIEKDPDGVLYDLDNSYVLVSRSSSELHYYVNLVANHGDNTNKNWHGIKVTERSNLDSDTRYELILKNMSLATNADIKQETGITITASTLKTYN